MPKTEKIRATPKPRLPNKLKHIDERRFLNAFPRCKSAPEAPNSIDMDSPDPPAAGAENSTYPRFQRVDAFAGQENPHIQQRPLYSTTGMLSDERPESSDTATSYVYHPPAELGRSHIQMHREPSRDSSIFCTSFQGQFAEGRPSNAEDLMSAPSINSSLGPQVFGPNRRHDLEMGARTFDYYDNPQVTEYPDQLHPMPAEAYAFNFSVPGHSYAWSGAPGSFIPDVVNGQGFFDPASPSVGPPCQTSAQAYHDHQAINNSHNLLMDDRSFSPPRQY